MQTNINPTEKLPLIFSPNKNMAKDANLSGQQTILKRNAVIDEFLNSLDNKNNNSNDSGHSENKELNNNEEDEIDDFFKDIKYLKKVERHNKNREIKELNKKRPKCYGRKIPSLLISNKNKNNEHDNELIIEKCSTLSFDNNELDSNITSNNTDKIITPRCVTNNDVIGYVHMKNKKHKKLPKIDISNLIFRNTKTNNYFLTSGKRVFTKSEYNINNIKDIKNNNSKWTNSKLLSNINSYFSNDIPINIYTNNLKYIRSKSHIGNRTQKNNLKILNKDISNLSPNLIAAQLYKNNSYFPKRLKRNYTAKFHKDINENRILSEKNENKKIFFTLNDNYINNNNNINNNSPKKTTIKNNSFRKLYNNKNYELNWINTIANNKNNFKIININKNEMSKKQLKLKLAELETNYKLKNDCKLFTKNKK